VGYSINGKSVSATPPKAGEIQKKEGTNLEASASKKGLEVQERLGDAYLWVCFLYFCEGDDRGP